MQRTRTPIRRGDERERLHPDQGRHLDRRDRLPGPGFWEGSDSDPTQVKSGFEFDIADAMRKAFGLAKLEVRNESFDSIVAGTITDYDLALSQISITCDRAKVATFTMPYFESNQGVLVNADSNVQVTTLAEAKKIKWGV